MVTVKPRIVACGTRRDAYDSFCTALENGDAACLLVDAEGPVASDCQSGDPKDWLPWLHLARRSGDEWKKPSGAAVLGDFFGQGFQTNKLPSVSVGIEPLPKAEVYRALVQATSACKTKASYGKGEHSFKLLALISSDKVMHASPWANRFVVALKCKMGV